MELSNKELRVLAKAIADGITSNNEIMARLRQAVEATIKRNRSVQTT